MTIREIHTICKQYRIENYTINDDMSIDVNGNVYLCFKNLEKLPLKFRKVNGYFDCSGNQLTTLEGSPIEVTTSFYCDNNKLISLKGCPIKVGNYFFCDGNKLISLQDGPVFLGEKLCCKGNPISEKFKNIFNNDYNLYLKYAKRQKILEQLIDD